ncbi:asparaginase [Calderihabitans maritimus]|uniref:asparaginase n=1 Tax=Calderihabitans maritimus TaxID=1246530 RepID=A0A1Z5HSA2_9FIRM|nr:asparaginase [Calderihabitans maritimus]GAW92160.1 asparaginase/glutaminase [Calderihabitans maritimus]
MKKILLISTGGTIAMAKDDNGLAQPTLDAQNLLRAVPEIKSVADVTAEQWLNVPSPFLQFSDLVELGRKINEAETAGYDGVVITQGTDTLEESAYFLDLILEISIPVVLTAAQRNPSLPSSDGPMNLLDAITVAADDQAKNYGVLVVANSEVHGAREVVKTHTSRIDTFRSPEFGPLGAISNGRVVWLRNQLWHEVFPIKQLVDKVEAVYLGLGSEGSVIEFLVDAGIKGIVIQALGGGHVPPKTLPAITKAVNKGIPVVITSRCHAGRLFTGTYGFQGAEKHLWELGTIFGDGLATSKARVKLVVLLSAGLSLDEIRYHFEKHFYA